MSTADWCSEKAKTFYSLTQPWDSSESITNLYIPTYLSDCLSFCSISAFFPLVWLKAFLVKAMVFPVVMYGCENGPIKKAECWRIDAFKLWHWRRLLRVPWTARRSNQSWRKSTLNIHWKDWCTEWLRNYGRKLGTLYRRWWSKPSPQKRNVAR